MKYNANTVYHKFHDTKSRGGEAERDCGGGGAKAAADIVRGKAKDQRQKTLGAFEKAPKPPKLSGGCSASLGGGKQADFLNIHLLNIYSKNGGCSVSSLTRSFKANNLSFSRTFCTHCIRFCQLLRSSRRRDIVLSTTVRAPSCSILSR